ncbi:MAG: pyridoxal-phosphate-dependent aminotransferase family protein [Candidatus Baldrarchaeia archaeon]
MQSGRKTPLLMLPGPTNVPDEVLKAMQMGIINHRGDDFHKLYEEITEGLKYVFQTEQEVFTLTASGTGAVETAISNVIKPGDNVLVLVNGEFGERAAKMAEIFGGKVYKLTADYGYAILPGMLEDFLERNKNMDVMVFVYNETSTGVRNPARELVSIAKDHGLLTICDAISNLGGDYLYMDKWGIDVVVSGSQKCIAAPPGLSFIALSDDAWKKVERNDSRRNYYFDLIRIREFHERRETPFTPAISLFYALKVALELIREEGLENRIKRHIVCSKALREGLRSLNLKLLVKDEEFASRTVTAVINPDNILDSEIRKLMLDKYNIAIAGGMGKLKGKIFRVGTMGIINRDLVIRFLEALENVLRELGYDITEMGKSLVVANNVFERNS